MLNQTRLSVLVVDDHRDGADSTALLLGSWGHDARVAYDGDQALRSVNGWAPDLVLMDLGLPGEDGYAVARRLCERVRRRPLLVALTGFGSEGHRERSRAEGFDHHLVKPVEPDALRAVLEEAADAVPKAGLVVSPSTGSRHTVGPG